MSYQYDTSIYTCILGPKQVKGDVVCEKDMGGWQVVAAHSQRPRWRNSWSSLGRGCPWKRPWDRPSATGSFPPSRTLWLFLAQVLAADGSCAEAVRKALAWRALEGKKPASPKTGAYCKARARLPKEGIEKLHKQLAQTHQTTERLEERWCGRAVKVVDGSGLTMPDTPENQAQYPQTRSQKPGCGFPAMRITALFSLSSGLLLGLAKGSLRIAETTLFRQLWDLLQAGDVLLADRGFCSYADFYFLGLRGVDCVMRNHHRRTVGIQQIKRLGKGDRLIRWIKTKSRPKWLTKEQWQAVPHTLLVRELTITIDIPGFRTDSVIVATTLLDAKQFPKEALAELYYRRWMAELFLRDIKITLGMDVLRCKSPVMVEKELLMHLIGYNLIRILMQKAARERGLCPHRLSFKGANATIRQWAPLLAAAALDDQRHATMTAALLDAIARDTVPLRPNRTEPRAKKRRPKNYQLLTKPRRQFKECPHRSKYTKP